MKKIISIVLSLMICSTCIAVVAVSPAADNSSNAGYTFEQTMLKMNSNIRDLLYYPNETGLVNNATTLQTTISDELDVLSSSYQAMTKSEKREYGVDDNFLKQIEKVRAHLALLADFAKNKDSYLPVETALNNLASITFDADTPELPKTETIASDAQKIKDAKKVFATLTADQKKSVDALLFVCSYDFSNGTFLTKGDILNTYQALLDNQKQLQPTLDYFYKLYYEPFCSRESESDSMTNDIKPYNQFKTAYEALSSADQKTIRDYWYLYTQKRMEKDYTSYGEVLNNLKTFELIIEDFNVAHCINPAAFADDTGDIAKEIKQFKDGYNTLSPKQKTAFDDYIKVNYYENGVKYVNKLTVLLSNSKVLKPLFKDFVALNDLNLWDINASHVTTYHDFNMRYTALPGKLKYDFDEYIKEMFNGETVSDRLSFKGKVLGSIKELEPVITSFAAVKNLNHIDLEEKAASEIADSINSAKSSYDALSQSNKQLFDEYSKETGYSNYRDTIRVYSAILENIDALKPLFGNFTESLNLYSVSNTEIKAYQHFEATYHKLTSPQKAAYKSYIKYEYQINLDDYFKLYDIVTANADQLELVLAHFDLLNQIELKDIYSDKVSPIITDTISSYHALSPKLKTAFNDYYSQYSNNPSLQAEDIIAICTDFVNNWSAFKPFYNPSNINADTTNEKIYNSFSQKQKDILDRLYQLGQLGTPPSQLY